jgi:hypothetical protein
MLITFEPEKNLCCALLGVFIMTQYTQVAFSIRTYCSVLRYNYVYPQNFILYMVLSLRTSNMKHPVALDGRSCVIAHVYFILTTKYQLWKNSKLVDKIQRILFYKIIFTELGYLKLESQRDVRRHSQNV